MRTKTRGYRKRHVSATIARTRLRELKAYYGSMAALQHNLFVSTGLRSDRGQVYLWLSGVCCPDGRIRSLNPPTRYLVNKWIVAHEGMVPSSNSDPFTESDWWTPYTTQNYKLKEIAHERE